MKIKPFIARKRRVRSRVIGTSERPRLSVFRSNRFIYAQIIDDGKAKTLVSFSERNLPKSDKKITKTEIALLIGEEIAKRASEKKITKVVFDRSGYKYHGRVEAVASGARKRGLIF